jgi:hypothetical protein
MKLHISIVLFLALVTTQALAMEGESATSGRAFDNLETLDWFQVALEVWCQAGLKTREELQSAKLKYSSMLNEARTSEESERIASESKAYEEAKKVELEQHQKWLEDTTRKYEAAMGSFSFA